MVALRHLQNQVKIIMVNFVLEEKRVSCGSATLLFSINLHGFNSKQIKKDRWQVVVAQKRLW